MSQLLACVAAAPAGVDERVLVGAVLLAVQDRDHLLAVAPLLELVGAGIPDRHLAAAVLAGRDRALERAVLDRVVLGLHGEVVLLRVGRHAAGQRPAHQHAVVLEPEVPVQAPGVVLLDHEDRIAAAGGLRRIRRHRLRRLRLVAHVRYFASLSGPSARSNVAIRSGVGSSDARCPAVSSASGSPFSHPLEHLGELELPQVLARQLAPGARRGDRRMRPAAQRVRRDRGLVAVVLAPVDQHLAVAQRLLHVADDEVGVVGLERPGELVGDRRHLVAGELAVQRGVEVDALAPAGHRHRARARCPARIAFAQPRDLGALRAARRRARGRGRARAGPGSCAPRCGRTATAARAARARPSAPARRAWRGRSRSGTRSGPDRCSMTRRFTQDGVPASRFFWKNTSPGCIRGAHAGWSSSACG